MIMLLLWDNSILFVNLLILHVNHFGFDIEWSGKGVEEVATIKETGEVLVKVNPEFYRPTEVDSLSWRSYLYQRKNWMET
jgi:GDP-D-mannose dehydratase